MPTRRDTMPQFDAPQPGGKSTSKLAVGALAYHRLKLQVVGAGPAAATLDLRNVVDTITLFKDDKPFMVFYPKAWREWQDYSNLNNDPLPVDFISLPLAMFGLRGSEWMTGNMKSLYVEVKVVDALPANTTFTKINGWMEFDKLAAPQDFGRAIIHNTKQLNQVPIEGPNNDFDNIELNDISSLGGFFIHVPPTAGNLTNNAAALAIRSVELHIGGEIAFSITKEALAEQLSTTPYYINPANEYGFPVILNETLYIDDFHPLVVPGVNGAPAQRLPIRLKLDWDTGAAAGAKLSLLYWGIRA